MSRSDRQGRRRRDACGGAALACLASALLYGCAPVAPMRGGPVAGAITVFGHPGGGVSGRSGALDRLGPGGPDSAAWLVPGSTDPATRRIGTIALPASRESVVVLVYGDNRPGLRLMTTPWGLSAVWRSLPPNSLDRWLSILIHTPIALVQGVIPTLDGFQDAACVLVTHRFTGGNEKTVLRSLEQSLPADLVVNTGDVVENGSRGRQWEAFAARHAALRSRSPFIAAVGNHERSYSSVARGNWDAALGPPPSAERYWYSIDLPDSLARFVFLDSNVLCDPLHRYPDSLEQELADEELAWADSALSAPARYKFLVFHHPLITAGHHFGDWREDDARPVELCRRARLLGICRRRGITAVLAGHEHLYQRAYVTGPDGVAGFWQITTGGGGAPLHHVAGHDRRGALAQTLPDGSKVVYLSREQSVYHYCRMVLRRRPRPGEPAVLLYVTEVPKRGRTSLIDLVSLAEPWENH